MKYLHELKEKLCKELDEIARKPEMGAGDLEIIHKLTDTIKNVDKINMLEEGEYSQAYNGYSRTDGSYERGNSYRRSRDSMGRYTRRYSRSDGTAYMVDQLEELMAQADNEQVKKAIRRAMEQIENA